jgi:uncharacterized protein (TIGR03083 family)
MKPLEPILVSDLFPKIEAKLIELLRSLSSEEWERRTVAPEWRAKDVAAHLLDTNLRKLSMVGDGYFGDSPGEIESYEDLVGFLNRLNAEWVQAMRRVSPRLITDLLEWSAPLVSEFTRGLDPMAQASFSVAWAGEEKSLNWFDIAREYTERWHHQQQIRLAVGKPGIETRELYYPVLDTFVRALPHGYRDVVAGDGTVMALEIDGEAGGKWFLVRTGSRWELSSQADRKPDGQVNIPQEIAWRVFTKGIDRESALKQSRISGERRLGEHLFGVLAVMA